VCRIGVLLIGKPGLSVYIVSWTQTFKVVVHMSHNHKTTWVVWIFHWTIHILVLRIVGVMHLAQRAFKVFDYLDQNLTRFVEQRIFSKCDQVIVSWLRGVEPRLA
jgi:hypothetical protein